VRLDPDFIKVRHRKGFRICVMCGEAYPLTQIHGFWSGFGVFPGFLRDQV